MRFWRGRYDEGEEPQFFREVDGLLEPLRRAPWAGIEPGSGPRRERTALRVEAPATPSKILCIGRNYRAHAQELGNEVPAIPTVFLKPASSLLAPGQPIVRPVHMSQLVHHEGELAVVLGRSLKNASPDEAIRAVFAYTCANDVTARDVQREDKHFTRAKGFDTFCPLGPVLVTPDALGDPQALDLEVTVDGEVRQRGSTRDMVFSVAFVLAYLSRIMTLEAGDVVLTGTPAGVGPLLAGNEVRVSISGIGALSNPVVDGPALAGL